MNLIIQPNCHSCGTCCGICPENAIILYFDILKWDVHKCIFCNKCIHICPVDALILEKIDDLSK